MSYLHWWIDPENGDNTFSGKNIDEPKQDWQDVGGLLSVIDTDHLHVVHHAKGIYTLTGELDLTSYNIILLGRTSPHLLVSYAKYWGTVKFAQGEIRGIEFQGDGASGLILSGFPTIVDVIGYVNSANDIGVEINQGWPQIVSMYLFAYISSPEMDGSYLLKYSTTSKALPAVVKNTAFVFDSLHPGYSFPESRIWLEAEGSDGMIYPQNNVYLDLKGQGYGGTSEILLDKDIYPTAATHKDPWPVINPGLPMVPAGPGDVSGVIKFLRSMQRIGG